eukprot:UN01537
MSIKLYFPCPHCDSEEPSFWKHVPCGCSSTINEYGKVGCNGYGAGCYNKRFIDCSWGCYRHDYKPADPKKFGIKVTIALCAMNDGLLSGDWTVSEVRTMSKALKAIAQTMKV